MFSARHEVAEIRSAARLPLQMLLFNWSDAPKLLICVRFQYAQMFFLCYNFQALIFFLILASSSWQERRVKQSLCGPCGELSEMGGWPFSYMSWTPVVNPVLTPKPTNSEAIFSGRSSKLEPFDWGQRPWPSEGWPKHRTCKHRRSGQDNKRGIHADPMFRVQN